MKGLNNRKTIVILILILLVGIVGLTVAYFSNTTSIDNLFSTKDYGTTIKEEFISPDNWLPGTTTPKEITVTNSGSVDEAVRISYRESWVAKDGTVLSGLIDEDGNLTSNEENSEHAVIINFSNNVDWNYSNGYYYYNYRLVPNETTSSLINSVTFNSKVKNSSNCTTTENNGVKTITCNSTNSGYDGATYTLTFTIETVQYDKYKQAWGVDVAIVEEKTVAPTCSYKMGDEISYDGEEYYVLNDSNDYVIALKKNPLTAEEVNTYSTDYVSQDGEYPYYKSSTCYMNYYPYPPYSEGDTSECISNYDQSSVKTIIDNWASSYINDLIKIDGYKARLVNENDIMNYLSYELSGSGTSRGIRKTNNTPEWAYSYYYWSMLSVEDSSNKVYYVGDTLYDANVYGTDDRDRNRNMYIRPVINLKKSAIENGCHIGYNYDIGSTITYNNQDYCIINNSKQYVTLIKHNPLTYDELVTYNNGYEIGRDSVDSNVGTISYYKSDTCYYNSDSDKNTSECSNEYNNSFIKNLINNWSNSISNDLKEVNGYKARLITNAELNGMGHQFINKTAHTVVVKSNYNCLYSDADYWTMSSSDDSIFYSDIVSKIDNNNGYQYVDKKYAVRPVINLKKCALTNTCE